MSHPTDEKTTRTESAANETAPAETKARRARATPRRDPQLGLGIALLAGVAAAALGPRLTAAQDKPAGEPFAYTPPQGFVVSEADLAAHQNMPGAQQVWVKPIPPSASLESLATYRPNVSLVHTPKTTHLDEAELTALALGMPQMFASSGITWTEVRHTTHTRPDGARVGIIEGSSVKGSLRYRSLQIAFPDDTGTSIVTASFPEDSVAAPGDGAHTVAEWNADFERTIDTAKGVAFRAPSPPSWSYVAWGAAAGLLTMLAVGVQRQARNAAKKRPTP